MLGRCLACLLGRGQALELPNGLVGNRQVVALKLRRVGAVRRDLLQGSKPASSMSSRRGRMLDTEIQAMPCIPRIARGQVVVLEWGVVYGTLGGVAPVA